MEFSLRRAHMLDADRIAQIHVESWRSTYAGIVPADYLASLDVGIRTVRWQEQLEKPENLIFVVEDSGGTFGFVSGGMAREPVLGYDSELYAIYLLHDHQKQGAGRATMQRLASELLARRFKGMALWVLRDNPAVGFYRRMGGRQIKEKIIEIGGKSLVQIALGWPNIAELLSNRG
jgi:ribosomal protein S18 acetylase RimI-like enzyme